MYSAAQDLEGCLNLATTSRWGEKKHSNHTIMLGSSPIRLLRENWLARYLSLTPLACTFAHTHTIPYHNDQTVDPSIDRFCFISETYSFVFHSTYLLLLFLQASQPPKN